MPSRQMLLRLGVAFAVAISSLALLACGSSGPSQEELDRARREGAAEARQQAKIEQIQQQLKALRHRQANGTTATTQGSSSRSGSSEATYSGPISCGGGLSVGKATTCEFARNVESEYWNSIGEGSGTVYAYSPATGKTYAMYCSAGTPHICTGGNEASVYFP